MTRLQRFVLIPMMCVFAFPLLSCLSLSAFSFGADRREMNLEEIEPAKSFLTRDQILMIPLSGIVSTGDEATFVGEPGMLVALKDRLKAAKDNDRLKAVILRIDSPGGGVTAADLIHREIRRFKEEKKIPVIAIMTDLAASGGLYISMAADEIYALPTTVTGSIGVITMFPGLKQLSDKIGFEMRVVKSGPNKDAGSMWRELTPEEKQIFQDLIDTYYRRFLSVILEARKAKGLSEEQLKAIADGRILDAGKAEQTHLIDGIRYPDGVIDRARELAGIADAKVVSYEYPGRFRGHFYAAQDAPLPAAAAPPAAGDFNVIKFDLGHLDRLAGKPQFLYLWMP